MEPAPKIRREKLFVLSFDRAWRRVRELTGLKTQAELAHTLGVTSSGISDAKKRGTFPLEWIYKLGLHYMGLDVNYILYGRKSPRARDLSSENLDLFPGVELPPVPAGPCDPDLVLVPKVRARLSAGTGSLETSAEVKGRFAFRREWITAKGQPSAMVLMDVTGDSMAPDIKDGDTVLIDESQQDLIAGAIFAVGLGEEVMVKRLDRAPGKLVLLSINPGYAPLEVDMRGDLSDQVRIVGRVVWWCREA